MIDSLVPPMVERIVAQRLRESAREQGGLMYKDMLALRSDIAQLRRGLRSPTTLIRPKLTVAQQCAREVLPEAHQCSHRQNYKRKLSLRSGLMFPVPV